MNLERIATTIGTIVETLLADPTRNSGRGIRIQQIIAINIIDGRVVWIGEATEKVELRPRNGGIRVTSIIETIGVREGTRKVDGIRGMGSVARVVQLRGIRERDMRTAERVRGIRSATGVQRRVTGDPWRMNNMADAAKIQIGVWEEGYKVSI